MYERVVVGVDGGQGGRDACALAASLASARATVTVAYVAVIAAVRPHTALEHADAQRLPELLAAERELCDDRADCVRLAATSVGEGLESHAARVAADLIVVGRSRLGGLAMLLSADDTRAVLRASRRAVAVAPIHYAERPRPIRRIGVAVDDRAPSTVALAHAGLLAAALHAEVACFTVPAEDSSVPELRRFARDVDLLVCGSRRLGVLRRALTDSVSERLTQHLTVPLLVAPPADPVALERWAAHSGAIVG